jgi:hypothetical protein
MIINKDEEIEFFETKMLAEFVKKNWALVQKKTIEKKYEYNTHAVSLEDFYRNENITPIKINLLEGEICDTLNALTMQTIDYANKICLLNCLV